MKIKSLSIRVFFITVQIPIYFCQNASFKQPNHSFSLLAFRVICLQQQLPLLRRDCALLDRVCRCHCQDGGGGEMS